MGKQARVACVAAVALAAGCSSDEEIPAGGVTFDDVAPLLSQHCNSCHREGGIAPYVFTDYASAAPYAPLIRAAVESRTMPPWGVDASGACGTYTEPRWLSEGEIAMFAAWVDAGAPAGAVDEAPPVARGSLTTDLVVEMEEAYTPPTSLEDDYRCFVLDPELDTNGYLTAYEVLPGAPSIVHHVILFTLIAPEADDEARALDDADPGAGYQCFGGPGVSFGGTRFLAGWAPGTGVTRYPEGTGIRVHADRLMVMQVHYNAAASPVPDRTRVALELAPSVEQAAEVLPMADLEMVLEPGSESATASMETLVEDPIDVRILGVYPHMHLRGRTLRVERERDGARDCVVDVPRWDFHWQQFYFYEEGFDVRENDLFRLTCTFDTRDDRAPVVWGEGTADEMCLAGFYVTPPIVGP